MGANFHGFTKLALRSRRLIESMADNYIHPNPHTGLGFPELAHAVDPIVQSNRLSLPFPCEAATALGDERGSHSEISEAAVVEAQKQIYLMASMMNAWNIHDDPPAAA